MERQVLQRKDVASALGISERTLTNYGSKYEVYKADRAGLYHSTHVRISVKKGRIGFAYGASRSI